MDLDPEDYELLGFGAPGFDTTANQFDKRVRQRLLDLRERYGKEWRQSPEGRRLRKEARERFMQTEKGKEMRARAWAKYYAKNRVKLVEQNRARRKAQK